MAGWRYSLDLITDDDVMSVLTRQKDLNFKPGEKHVYCNTGYTLLAIIVKRVSGMPFREFTTKNIFAPLGMKNTFFRDDHAEIVKNNALDTSRPMVKLSASASPNLTLRVLRVCTRQLKISLCGMKTSITACWRAVVS